MLSIIGPCHRIKYWLELYNSIVTDLEFEVIFVSDVAPDFELPSNFKCILSDTKPVQCVEIAYRASKGDIIHWTADDTLYEPYAFDKAVAKMKDYKTMVCFKTMEGDKKDKVATIDKTDLHYLFMPHESYANAPKTMPYGIMSRQLIEEVGGCCDRRFISGQWENDLVIRALNIGGKMTICREAVAYNLEGRHDGEQNLKKTWSYENKLLHTWYLKGDKIVYDKEEIFEPFEDLYLLSKNQGPIATDIDKYHNIRKDKINKGRFTMIREDIIRLNSVEKLKKVINGRTVGIIARGGSLIELENTIEKYKDYDICWASMNLFNVAEDCILSKIGKKLDIVSDCSTVKNYLEYEPKVRIPRFEEYLKRSDNNLLLISELVIKECFRESNKMQLFQRHINKIAAIDDVFNVETAPKEIWAAPPNSITLLLAACIAGGAKKIITFGFDGLTGADLRFLDKHCINTYYQSDLESEDRMVAAGAPEIGSLATDSFFFERDFPGVWNIYKQTYGNNCPIINCSPTTMFTCIRKIDYSQLEEELK